jgi:DNA-binding NtrC family response regulator
VYGIVKSHGGYIMCYSEIGEGTTFRVYLPAIEAAVDTAEVTGQVMALRGGSETILLVDDEESILNLGRKILEEYGYTVLMAGDGESALEAYRQEQRQIDLVILDLIMPGIGGRRCLDELFKISLQAKVVVASGYSAKGPVKETIEAGARGFIKKPYDMRQMLSVVRSVLDKN